MSIGILHKVKRWLLGKVGLESPTRTLLHCDEYWIDNRMLRNINQDHTRAQKRALVCYIPDQFFKPDSELRMHSNRIEAAQIIKVFSEWGFLIDVIWPLSGDDAVCDKPYDLIFGFGNSFIKAARHNPGALKISYITENHPAFVAEKYQERIDYFRLRGHESEISKARPSFYNEESFEVADYAVSMVSPAYELWFSKYFRSIHYIRPTGIFNNRFSKDIQKDFGQARRHFVWFGSFGAIHKGLDILIDVFTEMPDCILHICGLPQKERGLLPAVLPDNIVDHGFVIVQSDSFLQDIVARCAFVILPSCSECYSTSVVTCMLHGLIPVITQECGFVFDHTYQVALSDYRVENVRALVSELAITGPEVLKRMSDAAFNEAHSRHSIEKYTNDFRSVIQKIIAEYGLMA